MSIFNNRLFFNKEGILEDKLFPNLDYSGFGDELEIDNKNAIYSLDLGVIGGFSYSHFALKPHADAVMHYLNKYHILERIKMEGKDINFAVVGDDIVDIKQGYFLKEALKKQLPDSKVRVDRIGLNRYGNFHPSLTHSVRGLSEVVDLCVENNYDILFCDGDNTLWSCPVVGKPVFKDDSLFEKVRKGQSIFFNNACLLDFTLSLVGLHKRRLYNEKNDSTDEFLKKMSLNKTSLVVNSLASEYIISSQLNKLKDIDKRYIYGWF